MKYGQLTLHHADCMPALRAMEDNQFDVAIVDPPYGIGMSGGNVGYKGFNDLPRKDWDNEIPNDKYFTELYRVSKNQIIWGGNYFGLRGTKCYIVWSKGAGFKDRSYAEAELAWCSLNKNVKVFDYDPLAKRDYYGKIHPTQKPVALYKWLLKNYANEGDTILDTHLGSGSIAIACYYMGFDLTGYEIDAEYYTAMMQRITEQTAQETLF